jgi:excinuclease UvrABC nuclease subunit
MRSSDIGKEVIKKELPLIPKSPGVYKMLNQKGDILYVGKAKNLPNRLKSYVSEKNHIIRTERMLSQTAKLEITITANESEALLLEANLIKKTNQNLIFFSRTINHFHLYLSVTKISGLKSQNIEVKKIKMDFISVHLHQLDQQIGL